MVQISLTRRAILSSLFFDFLIERDESLLPNLRPFGSMMRKVTSVSLSILLLLPLFSGSAVPSALARSLSSSSEMCSGDDDVGICFQKPCGMDNCTPLPRCPLCSSSSSISPYLYQDAGAYLPPPRSSFIMVSPDALTDQGFVTSIFRPPTSPQRRSGFLSPYLD